MELYVGTSGYAYKEWKGSFYPEDLPSGEYLAYYGERFRSVEINNTFYRMPKTSVLEAWAAAVPDAFRFTIKASQRITHRARLRDTDDSVEYLLKQVVALGDKLGPLLFQLPPNMKADVDRLRSFLARLPPEGRAALEVRHASWLADEPLALLRDHNVAVVCSDTEDEAADEPIVQTADWGYLRLRRCDYTDEDLARWRGHIEAQPWQCAYVYFKHEDDGTGPDCAVRFQQ